MQIATSLKAAQDLKPEYIYKDSDTSYRCYFEGEIAKPAPVADARTDLAREIDASPALKLLTEEIAALKGVTKGALVVSLDAKVAK